MKDTRPRYISYEILSKEDINHEDFKKEFLKKSLSLLGELDYKNANILILEKGHKDRGIIRCSHRHVDKIKLVLALIKEINNKEVIVQSLKVSGTLKSLKR